MFIVRRSAAVAQAIYNPSGDSTPYKREYSYAESLDQRGRYGDAAAAYELHCLEYPDDPEPYLRLARLYRDKLNQYEDALNWFRRARADARLTSGQQLLVIQEIVEIYLRKLRTPRKAIPELVLLCEKFPNTPAAEAAAGELAEMREMMERERTDLVPFTAQFLEKIGRGSVAGAAGQARRDVEADLVRDALRECGGDRQRAAARLGVSIETLERNLSESA
jgi:tetratricopeptide (TPR) repeat protein